MTVVFLLECEIRGFASSALKADKLFVLVKAVQYLLVSFSGENFELKLLQIKPLL